MVVINMRTGLPNFFLDSKDTYKGNFPSVEVIIEHYDELSGSY